MAARQDAGRCAEGVVATLSFRPDDDLLSSANSKASALRLREEVLVWLLMVSCLYFLYCGTSYAWNWSRRGKMCRELVPPDGPPDRCRDVEQK